MKHIFYTILLFCWGSFASAQTSITGYVLDDGGQPLPMAHVSLIKQSDSSLTKVVTTTVDGLFEFQFIKADRYFLSGSFSGFATTTTEPFVFADKSVKVADLQLMPDEGLMEDVVVSATREMVEVHNDKTTFNVEGTVNAAGSDGLELIRKAPGVLVDNNDNISVLGKSGVIFYIDGRRSPLQGDELVNYLKTLTADQIDKIDIISNPSAKYDAQGSAGIIDIHLKKNENYGANGSVSTTASHGKRGRYNLDFTGNMRNKKTNIYSSVGRYYGDSWNESTMDRIQQVNDLGKIGRFNQYALDQGTYQGYNVKGGLDYFFSEKHVAGVMYTGNINESAFFEETRVDISEVGATALDSVLLTESDTRRQKDQHNFNANYQFTGENDVVFSADFNYGTFTADNLIDLPNIYFTPDLQRQLSVVHGYFDMPQDIQITTGQLDYERSLGSFKVETGVKVSDVTSDNSFNYYDVVNEDRTLSETRSNNFKYTERVYAVYASTNQKLSEQLSWRAGLRFEQTESEGELLSLVDNSVTSTPRSYPNLFPNLGLSYQMNQKNAFSLSYSHRINRPNYHVLNPFENQLNELTFEQGNPNLRPEIIKSLEVNHNFNRFLNTKLSYSRITDQHTRLISADEDNEKASYITWDNLATQDVLTINSNISFEPVKGVSSFFTGTGSYLRNRADYGTEETRIDLSTFTYNFYTQHTISLPWEMKGEVSGYYSGPGIWGGTFFYDSQWALNLGLQKSFIDNQLKVRVAANDLFFQQGWSGVSEFGGLEFTGSGNWDSRRVSISVNYNFGNQKVKTRRRKSTAESENSRLG